MSQIVHGDMLDVLAGMTAQSIDACVTDPPYGLSFMGRDWDHGVPGVPYWQAVLRVLKPSGHLLAFGGTRTHHRLMCAIEDAGFEIRDCLLWLYGQGFPKGKACLKPGWEPIVLARKPAPSPWLNVDGCRIGTTDRWLGKAGATALGVMNDDGWQAKPVPYETHPAGRWPANVVLSHEDGCREVGTKRVKGSASREVSRTKRTAPAYEFNGAESAWNPNAHTAPNGYAGPDGTETVAAFECVPECAVRMLDEQSGVSTSSGQRRAGGRRGSDTAYAQDAYSQSYQRTQWSGPADTGGASRFFYCPKASSAERGPTNDWPTVKPLALMRWLVRLVTPPGGTVLDPFCGSGSTLLAADREGFDTIGIDQDAHAVEIARRRLTEDAGMFAEVTP